ncbi:MAG: hypothetical protein ACLQVG_01825 [Terriglobia bacterium]
MPRTAARASGTRPDTLRLGASWRVRWQDHHGNFTTKKRWFKREIRHFTRTLDPLMRRAVLVQLGLQIAGAVILAA